MKLMALSVGLATLFMLLVTAVFALDMGQWAQVDPAQREFYEGLKNKNGRLCCADNDGFDAVWEIRGNEYWVGVNGQMVRVPPQAVLDVPNRYGIAKVWYSTIWKDGNPTYQINCFLKGSEV